MTSDLGYLILLGLGIAAGFFILGAKAGHTLGRAGRPLVSDETTDSTGPGSNPHPRIVINVPADYRPIEPLMVDGKPALVGPRALLFVTLYKAALAAFSKEGSYTVSEDEEVAAYEAAKMGVKTVYGETFDS